MRLNPPRDTVNTEELYSVHVLIQLNEVTTCYLPEPRPPYGAVNQNLILIWGTVMNGTNYLSSSRHQGCFNTPTTNPWCLTPFGSALADCMTELIALCPCSSQHEPWCGNSLTWADESGQPVVLLFMGSVAKSREKVVPRFGESNTEMYSLWHSPGWWNSTNQLEVVVHNTVLPETKGWWYSCAV